MHEEMNITIPFLGSMKKQLGEIENRLISVAEDVKEMKEDVKYLIGKSIPELIDQKYQELMISNQTVKKVNIPLKAHYYGQQTNEKEKFGLMKETFNFIRAKDKSVLLVLGESGSGKSTFLKN